MRSRNATLRLTAAVSPGRHPDENAAKIPYDDLSDLEKEAIVAAIGVAWLRLPDAARLRGIDWMVMDETPLTRLLRDELDKLRRDKGAPVPGFTECAFQHMPESEGVPDSSGSLANEHTKQPDLVFRPVIVPQDVLRTSTYGWFVECKILHRSVDHHAVTDYCKDGLQRFIDGRYAYMMPSGLMLAYVRNRQKIPSVLVPYLRQASEHAHYEVKSLPEPWLAGDQVPGRPGVYVSRHGRSQVQVGTRSPGNIAIAHLWLDAPAE